MKSEPRSFSGWVASCGSAAAILLATFTPAAEPADDKKLYTEARDLARRHKDEEALRMLRQVVDRGAASVGDVDVAVIDARRLYVETAISLANTRAVNHLEVEAAEALWEQGHLASLHESGEALKTRASDMLSRAFKDYSQKRDQQQVLACAEAWERMFPDKEPLIAKDAMVGHRVRSLALYAKQGSAKWTLDQFRTLKEMGAGDQLAGAGLSEGMLILGYAKSIYNRGWYREAASLMRDQLKFEQPDPALKNSMVALEEQSLINYAEACLKFGNLKMCKEALLLYEEGARPNKDKNRATAMGRSIAAMEKCGAPRELTFPGKYVSGKGLWKDTGSGFFINGTLQTGNCADSRGGVSETAEIEVAPGTLIEGGLLRVSKGRLSFIGTAEKPVIIKDVRIECDYSASIVAQNTLFINCSLSKSGGIHYNAGFTTKWEFTDCMLVSSNYSNLSRVDYGIRWLGTTFLRCNFPQRILANKPPMDGAAEYKSHWNTIAQCAFWECNVPPSLVWGAEESIWADCSVTEKSEYSSITPIEVTVSAFPPAFLNDLRKGTVNTGAECVTFKPSRSTPKYKPGLLWKLIPEIASKKVSG